MKWFFKKITLVVLIAEAKLVLRKYKPSIVAISGSVGKTSTRDAVYTVLASKFFTRKSDKSLSNELLVPLTILGQPYGGNNPFIWFRTVVEGLLLLIFSYSYPAWLVLEIGADRPGDIQAVTRWIRPNIAVITNFGFGDTPVHVEFFPSIDNLITEESLIVRALVPDGLLVFNHDDEKVRALADTVAGRKMSYGFTSGALVQALESSTVYGLYENSEIEFPRGVAVKAEVSRVGILSLALVGALGRQHVLPLLAATAVGFGLDSEFNSPRNLTVAEITSALKNHVSPRGRMKLLPGIRDTLIIDDSYNASPVAVSAALEVLKNLKTAGRKIAVLGDMLELGRYSIAAHRRMGEEAAKSCDILVTVGIRSREAAETALDKAPGKGLSESAVFQFDTGSEAGKYIAENILKSGDIVLVKGSQTMRMERCVEALIEHAEEKEKLLVRQDPQWLRRK